MLTTYRFIALTALLATLLACGPSSDDVGRTVQFSMQDWLASNPDLRQYKLKVTKVMAVKESGNKYQGIATIRFDGVERQVPVQITSDGEAVIWRTEPGAFLFVVQGELQKAFGQ